MNTANPISSEDVEERTKALANLDQNLLLAYLVALQERLLSEINALRSEVGYISQIAQQQAFQSAPIPAPQKATEYEYVTATIRSGIFSEDKAVNKKVEEMSRMGWELVGNTLARATITEMAGRMLQFRRQKRR